MPSVVVITIAVLTWSTFLTEKFGPGYLTTTSTDLSFMMLWGSGITNLGNPKYPSIWRRLNEHYTTKSREQKVTFKEAVQQDKSRVWKELTFKKYAKGVKNNFVSFISIKGSRIGLILRKSKVKRYYKYIDSLQVLNSIVCSIILLSIGLLFFFPKVISSTHRQLLGLLLFIAPFLLVHIFVAKANARHGMILWWSLAAIGSVVISSLFEYKKRSVAVDKKQIALHETTATNPTFKTGLNSYLISLYSLFVFILSLITICIFY